MVVQQDVEALEALSPWDDATFQAGLASLTLSVTDASRAFARAACTLAALAAQVPRCVQDEVGGTPWTSFRQQVAVARKVSSAAAAAELRIALRLTTVLPRTLHLLETGRLTVVRAGVRDRAGGGRRRRRGAARHRPRRAGGAPGPVAHRGRGPAGGAGARPGRRSGARGCCDLAA